MSLASLPPVRSCRARACAPRPSASGGVLVPGATAGVGGAAVPGPGPRLSRGAAGGRGRHLPGAAAAPQVRLHW